MGEMIVEEKWVSLIEAANFFGVKPSTIRAWIKNGRGVPCVKIGKSWRFKYSELDAWAKSCKVEVLSNADEHHEEYEV